MKLIELLGLQEKELVAFVGGGGKSSLMLALAQECHHSGKRILITTSTKMYRWQMEAQAQLLIEKDPRKLLERIKHINYENIIAAGRSIAPEGKILGLSKETIDLLYESDIFDYILVEADGSNHKPIKAPEEGEPVVPSLCTQVVTVIGMDALDKLISEENVHRPQLFSEIIGLPIGGRVTEASMAKIMFYYAHLIKHQAPNSKLVAILNKVDNDIACEKAKRIAAEIAGNSEVNKVLLTSLLYKPW